MERMMLQLGTLCVYVDQEYKYDITGSLYFKLKKSIQVLGQLRPLNVVKINERYHVVEGRKIFKALQELGVQLVHCNVHELTSDQIIHLRTVMNDLNFFSCHADLSTILNSSTQTTEELGNILPFTRDEIELLKKLLDFDWEGYNSQDTNQQSLF
jgi:hypothetical protein